MISAVNKYIVDTEPWALAEREVNKEENLARLATILYTCAEALRIVTALVHPVTPDSTARIWAQLGLGEISSFRLDELKWGQLQLGTKLGKVEPVFPRVEKNAIEKMQQIEQSRSAASSSIAPVQPAGRGAVTGQAASQSAVGESKTAGAKSSVGTVAAGQQLATQAPSSTTANDGKITIDDFAKIELRVGQVKVAEPVKGADKLLRLEVDIGTEVRQVVAGIAKAYAPETLIGRKVVILTNLAPRKLRGLESNGMIIAASFGEEGVPVLATFLEDVPVGARLK